MLKIFTEIEPCEHRLVYGINGNKINNGRCLYCHETSLFDAERYLQGNGIIHGHPAYYLKPELRKHETKSRA